MHSEVLPRQEAAGLGQVPGPAPARGLFCVSLSGKAKVTAARVQATCRKAASFSVRPRCGSPSGLFLLPLV